jgi:hypothetical protein
MTADGAWGAGNEAWENWRESKSSASAGESKESKDPPQQPVAVQPPVYNYIGGSYSRPAKGKGKGQHEDYVPIHHGQYDRLPHKDGGYILGQDVVGDLLEKENIRLSKLLTMILRQGC